MARATGKSGQSSAASGALPPIAVFSGPERFGQLHQTEVLRGRLIARHGEVMTVTFDGGSCQAAEVLDECRSMSLMQQHKLVIVENAELLMKESGDEEGAPAAPPAAGARGRGAERTAREMFISYAEAPDPGATLVLRATRWYKSKLDAAIDGHGGVRVQCDPLSDEEAVAWAIERAKSNHGCVLMPDAARLLVESVGTDLGRIDCEIEKLAVGAIASSRLGSGDGKSISHKLVDAMVADSKEEEAWKLQSGLLSGDAARALGELRQALEVSRLNPVAIHWGTTDLARKLDAACRGLRAKENPRSLAGRLRLWGSAGDSVLRAAGKLHPGQTAGLLAAAVDADARLKSGRGEQQYILEAMVLRFTAAFR